MISLETSDALYYYIPMWIQAKPKNSDNRKRNLEKDARKKTSISAQVDRVIRKALQGQKTGSYHTLLHRITSISNNYYNEPTWRKRGRALLYDYACNQMDDWPESARKVLHKAFLNGGGMGQYDTSGEQTHRLFRKLIATLL